MELVDIVDNVEKGRQTPVWRGASSVGIVDENKNYPHLFRHFACKKMWIVWITNFQSGFHRFLQHLPPP